MTIAFLKEKDRIMKAILSYLLLLLPFTIPVTAQSADSIPNVSLDVTVQQKEDGKISKGFHVLELSCGDGQCSLSTVSLNQCMESGSGKIAFYPKVEYAATWMGNLTVKNEGNSLIVQESGSDMLDGYVTNLRFDYEPAGKDKIVIRLIGFSGGYIKNSKLLKKVITTEYVPLPKAYQVMKLDCDVLLPGVDKK
jgi:hypothetical protein